MFENVSSCVDIVVFCRIHNELSLSKNQRENYHLDRKAKVDVLQAINEALSKPKPGGKKWSNRDLAEILTKKLGRNMTHTTVGNLRKKAALVKKQPEADGESNRWRYKKNRQFRLLSKEMLQFESDLEELLDRAFSLGNLTLDTICRAANHLAGQHGVERKDPNGQVIPFGRKWARSFAKRQKWSFVRTQGKKMKNVVDDHTIQKSSTGVLS